MICADRLMTLFHFVPTTDVEIIEKTVMWYYYASNGGYGTS